MNYLKALAAALLSALISWGFWALTPWPIMWSSATLASAWLGWLAFFQRKEAYHDD